MTSIATDDNKRWVASELVPVGEAQEMRNSFFRPTAMNRFLAECLIVVLKCVRQVRQTIISTLNS
jgi:hypothetical protein